MKQKWSKLKKGLCGNALLFVHGTLNISPMRLQRKKDLLNKERGNSIQEKYY